MRDKKKQQQWMKDNYDTIVGFRPIRHFDALMEDGQTWTHLSPKDFLFGGTTKRPFKVFGEPERNVHVPRTLLRRVKICVDKVTRQVKGTSAMYYANK